MQHFSKYFAQALLAVFLWIVLPAPLLHEIFANHTDTECERLHHDEIAQVEAKHTHCDIFQTNAPVYDQPEFVQPAPCIILLAEIHSSYTEAVFFNSDSPVSNRGPPSRIAQLL